MIFKRPSIRLRRKTNSRPAGRRANARNVSFRISLRWPIHIINPVDKTKLSSCQISQAPWAFSWFGNLVLRARFSFGQHQDTIYVPIVDHRPHTCRIFYHVSDADQKETGSVDEVASTNWIREEFRLEFWEVI